MEKTEKDQKIGDWLIYKNNQLIAFNKPSGIAVQSDKTGDKPFLDIAEIFTKSKLDLIHRIDRPASGIVLFAKNKKALAHLNDQFQQRKVEKIYLAVVNKKEIAKEGTLVHYLQKNGRKNRSFVSEEERPNSKKAELSYSILASIDNYHLLEVKLKTGRHHQIRAQLAAIDCPIKGDVKYGARRANKDRSIHLHAWKLSFRHPISNIKEELIAPIPEEVVWQAFEL
ncbi:MAG: RNA pseudouridine synthase [Bacteroidetes bacterium]|jgi:23S rRNA pseudouridine1911/1915/1917 synthase|nr:RNA pseudouridine synthase [Bacteroidota bacterium]MDF1865728.1 RNA pseudouridine synthase [Saprospiraceae bacterium]